MVTLPVPGAEEMRMIFVFLFGFLIGLPVPYFFATERIKGFCRWILIKLPYEPPPGKDEKEAMEEAVEEKDE